MAHFLCHISHTKTVIYTESVSTFINIKIYKFWITCENTLKALLEEGTSGSTKNSTEQNNNSGKIDIKARQK